MSNIQHSEDYRHGYHDGYCEGQTAVMELMVKQEQVKIKPIVVTCPNCAKLRAELQWLVDNLDSMPTRLDLTASRRLLERGGD